MKGLQVEGKRNQFQFQGKYQIESVLLRSWAFFILNIQDHCQLLVTGVLPIVHVDAIFVTW